MIKCKCANSRTIDLNKHLDAKAKAKKLERKQRYHSKFEDYDKHTKAKSQKEAIEFSKKEAQYWDEENDVGGTSFRSKIGEEALRNGVHVPQEGGADYYLYDAGRTIGYNNGKPTSVMRVEVIKAPQPVYHGHPMNETKYNQTLKKD